MRHGWMILAVLALAACSEDAPVPDSFSRAEPWDAETLRIADSLPVQEGGRIKPLQSYAGFLLLHMNGKRSLRLPGNGLSGDEEVKKEKLDPTGFMLDCFFFPEQTKDYQCFVVSNSSVLAAIGVESKKIRARYSYNELLPGRSKLFQQAMDASERQSKAIVDQQLMSLAKAMHGYEAVLSTLDLARVELEIPAGVMGDVLGDEPMRGVSGVLSGLPTVIERLRALPEDEAEVEAARYADFGRTVGEYVAQARSAPSIFPPETTLADKEEWLNPSDVLFEGLFQRQMPVDAATTWLAHLEKMAVARNDRETFRGELLALRDGIRGEANRRGEYGKIGAEVTYYRADLVMKSLVFFLLGFVLVAFSWLFAKSRWIARGSLACTVVATLCLVAAVAWRAYIRGRPPVSNLYDTILFITGIACIAGLVMEAINRKRVGLSLAPILGAMGMFLAFRYEVKDAAMNGDTMGQLQAVLDTNFWLATHVTSVTAGYGAGLIATVLSVTWILCRTLGVKKGQASFYRDITKMAYGALCFGLLLSVVGTILGGVWGNESWGRFWGWDPKENGALLICLAELFILHARLGGYIKQFGMHILNCGLGAVICFSWWGVNELDAGLHSYGKVDGVRLYLNITYGTLAFIAVVGMLLWIIERTRGRGPGGGDDEGGAEVEFEPELP